MNTRTWAAAVPAGIAQRALIRTLQSGLVAVGTVRTQVLHAMLSVYGTVASGWARDWHVNTAVTTEAAVVAIRRIDVIIEAQVDTKGGAVGAGRAVVTRVLAPVRLVEARRTARLVVTAHWTRVPRAAGVLLRLCCGLSTGAEVAGIALAVGRREVVLCAVVARRAGLAVGDVNTAHVRCNIQTPSVTAVLHVAYRLECCSHDCNDDKIDCMLSNKFNCNVLHYESMAEHTVTTTYGL